MIVTGRANAGKSTLLNAVLGRKALVHTSKKAVRSRPDTTRYAAERDGLKGRTRVLNFFRVGAPPGKLILVDAPGYGARGRAEWGKLFDGYLETRKECACYFIL